MSLSLAPASTTPLPIFLYFAGLWCAVCYFLALMGGWRRLAKVYRHRGRFEGHRWPFRIARMRRLTHYGGCVTYGANAEGLYFALLFLFRVAHPPLFVPWVDIQVQEFHGRAIEYIEFRFRRAVDAPIRVPKPLALAILQEAGREYNSLLRPVA